MSSSNKKQNFSDEEYFDADNVDENLRALEDELLESKPKLRRNPDRAGRMQQNNPPIKNKRLGKKNPNISDSLLRIENDDNAPKANDNASEANENVEEDNLYEAFGNSVAGIKNSMSAVDGKLNRMLEIMRKFSSRVKKLELQSNEQEACITNQQKEIDVLRNRCEANDRISRLNKIIMNYSAIDTTHENYQVNVKCILRDISKLAPAVIDEIFISKFGKSKSTVLLDLPSIATKATIFRCRADLRSSDDYSELFLNEFLSKRNAEIMKAARAIKKKKLLHSVFSLNGQIYVKTTADDEKRFISSLDGLKSFITRD